MATGIVVDDDDYHSAYGMNRMSMTSLPGPRGTRGKDSRGVDKRHVQELIKEGYSTGLAQALSENAATYDFRFWVVDNSGSMQIGDGHRFVSTTKKGGVKAVACTRWEELQGTVKYHAKMAALLDSPTIFQLLNNPGMRTAPQKFSVCELGEASADEDVRNAANIIKKVRPTGVTPLTQHIWEIQENIARMAPELRRRDKKVALVLATDGLPTDGQGYGGNDVTDEFIKALRSLEGLPVWVVVRLCTDEDSVTQFYNSLDNQLELSLEVLDDYIGEAKEVYAKNPWITYGMPLHRCRELGYHDRLFDLMDERPFTKGEVRSFCCLIFGLDDEELPDPGVSFTAFLKAIKVKLDSEQFQWNPMKKKMTPWILTSELNKQFSSRPCTVM